MELTPDDKRRIEEEEERRLVEQQFREQVRRKLADELVSATKPKPGRKRLTLTLCAAGLIVLVVVSIYVTQAKHISAVNEDGAPNIAVGSSNSASKTNSEATESASALPLRRTGTSLESLLPSDAKIIETAALGQLSKPRTLVLWMLHPSRESADVESCETSVHGKYWEGPARLSLVNQATDTLINTVNVEGPLTGATQVSDSFRFPFYVSSDYYYVPNPDVQKRGTPTILHLQDMTGEGLAAQFALFAYEACGIVATSVFGYSRTMDRVVQYPIATQRPEGNSQALWAEQVFARKPSRPGFWSFTWSPGHGATQDFREEVTFDVSNQTFVDSRTVMTAGAPTGQPTARPLLSGDVVVAPQQVRYWQFSVDTSMTNVRVAGEFRASGGSGNDIEAIVAEWGQCQNWINGHQARVLYTSGKITDGSLDVPILNAGTYCVAFSNRMALLSSKTISGVVGLRYTPR